MSNAFTDLIMPFAKIFSKRVFPRVQELVTGAILAVGKRTISAILRVLGLEKDEHYETYHRVLNRDSWSVVAAGRVLLQQILAAFVPTGPIVFGIDDTIERRWGKRIAARGIYRDAVRSSHSHLVKTSGLRWLSLMVLAPISWAQRIWALPFLTALAPSSRYYEERGRAPQPLTVRAQQLIQLVDHWLPDRPKIVVGDGAFAALDLLAAVRDRACMVARLRFDAALFAPALPRRPGTKGRPRVKGERLPSLTHALNDPATVWQAADVPQWYSQGPRTVEFTSGTAVWYSAGKPPVPIRWVLVRDPQGQHEPAALLCTNLNADPIDIVTWFVQRWTVEVTFEEARAHLGVETQRQWNDKAIARTTPLLFGLFSFVTLLAHRLQQAQPLPDRPAAWYHKRLPTFVDALACARRYLWRLQTFSGSLAETEMEKIPQPILKRWQDTLCYAA